MSAWNDRRTPPGQLTDLSVQMGAKYAAPAPEKPKPAIVKPDRPAPTAPRRYGKQ